MTRKSAPRPGLEIHSIHQLHQNPRHVTRGVVSESNVLGATLDSLDAFASDPGPIPMGIEWNSNVAPGRALRIQSPAQVQVPLNSMHRMSLMKSNLAPSPEARSHQIHSMRALVRIH